MSSATFQFRIACEGCHARKIKCYPSVDDNSGACEACRSTSRRCLFSLKGKLGRPKKVPTGVSTPDESTGVNHSPLPSSLSASSLSQLGNYQNIQESVPVEQINYNASVASAQSPLNSTRHSISGHIAERGQHQHQSYDAPPYDPADSTWSSILGHDMVSDDTDVMNAVYDTHNTPFDDRLDVLPRYSMARSSSEAQLPAFAKPRVCSFGEEKSQTAFSCLDVAVGSDKTIGLLAVYSDLQGQGLLLSRRRYSLTADTDQGQLSKLMDAMQHLSDKICAIQTLHSTHLLDTKEQSLTMLIFAMVVTAVDTIGKFAELDCKFRFLKMTVVGTDCEQLSKIFQVVSSYISDDGAWHQVLDWSSR